MRNRNDILSPGPFPTTSRVNLAIVFWVVKTMLLTGAISPQAVILADFRGGPQAALVVDDGYDVQIGVATGDRPSQPTRYPGNPIITLETREAGTREPWGNVRL